MLKPHWIFLWVAPSDSFRRSFSSAVSMGSFVRATSVLCLGSDSRWHWPGAAWYMSTCSMDTHSQSTLKAAVCVATTTPCPCPSAATAMYASYAPMPLHRARNRSAAIYATLSCEPYLMLRAPWPMPLASLRDSVVVNTTTAR